MMIDAKFLKLSALIALFLAVLTFSLFIRNWKFPVDTFQVRNIESGETSNVFLPGFFASSQISFNLRESFFAPRKFRIRADDCILELWVNQKKSSRFTARECAHDLYSRFFEFDFSKELRAGAAQIVLTVPNKIGPGSLQIEGDLKSEPRLQGLLLFTSILFLYFAFFSGVRLSVITAIPIFCGMFVNLVLALWNEGLSLNSWDSSIYLAVGRGILNNKVLYLDLFETKPPGMFIISAIGLYLTGGAGFTGIFSVLGALLLFLCCLLVLAGKEKSFFKSRLLGASIACLLTLFSLKNAADFQVELFGSAFAALYVVLITSESFKHQGLRTLALSVCILFSVGLKEPYLFVILACGFLNSTNWRRFFRDLVLPLVLSVFWGLIVLAFCGWLKSYWQIYLPIMIFEAALGHDSNAIGMLLLERFISAKKIFEFYKNFSAYLVYSLAGLFSLAILKFLWSCRNFKKILSGLKVVAAIGLLVFTINCAGYNFGHHFVKIIPAVLLSYHLLSEFLSKNKLTANLCACLLLLSGPALVYPFRFADYGLQNKEGWRQIKLQEHKKSETLDASLLECGFKEYLWIGGNASDAPYATSRISPKGPLFFQLRPFTESQRVKSRMLLEKTFKDASLVIFQSYYELGEMEQGVAKMINEHYSSVVPDCLETAKKAYPHLTFYVQKIS